MPAPRVYGKKTRGKFDLLGANFSSPEHPLPAPVKPVQATHIRFEDTDQEDAVRRSPRRTALGERSHNAVVLPLEVVQHVEQKEEKRSKKPKARRKETDAGYETNSSRRRIKRDLDEASEQKIIVHPAANEVDNIYAPVRTSKSPNKTHTSRQDTVSKKTIDDPLAVAENGARSNTNEHHCCSLLQLSNHRLTCFESWSGQLSEHFNVTKIAEASFGEVYRLSLRETIPDFSSSDESVFKIIPLQAAESSLPLDKRKRAAALKKQETMSKPLDVASEVKLLQRMSAIPGFTNFRDVRVLEGRPPPAFIDAFKTWNAEQKAKKRELSHFPDPARKTSYTDNQLWAVIEMQDAGNDLERLVESNECTSIWTVWDIFWQVVLTLAKGEEGAEFEHRDLHLGNICVRSCSTPAPSDIDISKNLNFTSLETTIIDYTISRCTMSRGRNDSSKPEIAYIDLSLDPALFEGDSTEEYQYDIYRYMRSALFLDSGLADFHSTPSLEGRSWEQFHAQTNLVWLHLVLYKLLEQIAWPSKDKKGKKKVRGKEEEHARWKRSVGLEKVLLQVQELLYPGHICANGIRSASDLVVLALSEEWLNVDDVVGHGAGDESALVSQLEALEL